MKNSIHQDEDDLLIRYENCDFIEENIYEIDLFEGFFTIRLDHAYLPFSFSWFIQQNYSFLQTKLEKYS